MHHFSGKDLLHLIKLYAFKVFKAFLQTVTTLGCSQVIGLIDIVLASCCYYLKLLL